MRAPASPHPYEGTNPNHEQEPSNRTSKCSCSWSGMGGGFWVSLGDLAESQKDTGPQRGGAQVLSQGFPPEKTTGQYRETETHGKTHRHSKDSQGWPHIHTPEQTKRSSGNYGSQTLDQQPRLTSPVCLNRVPKPGRPGGFLICFLLGWRYQLL